MGSMKTPGVYIVEKSAFPSSTVEVATAVPAFIGYTEMALNGNVSLLNKPFRITSMAEYHSFSEERRLLYLLWKMQPTVRCRRWFAELKNGGKAHRCTFYFVLPHVDVLCKRRGALLHCFCR